MTRFNRFSSRSPFPNFRTQLADSFRNLPARARKQGIPGSTRIWTPLTDVTETDSEYRIRMDLPGLTKGDITLRAKDHCLTIQGKRPPAAMEDDERPLRVERTHGGFYRSIPLPETADLESVTAVFENGMLTIRISKAEERASRTIKIS